jgi:hypothetical protein
LRYLTIMAMALGALAIPSTAFANHGGNDVNCGYATGKAVNSGDLNPNANQTLIVYADITGATPGTIAKVGACADNNGTVVVGPIRADGGTAEVGVGDDPAGGAGDPGLVAGQPDLYAVVDGDDQNVDPQGQSDGYVGVSNWENSTPGDRTTAAECAATGPDNGAAGSSNSGGCLGIDGGPWVYVPGDLPTPVCGNSSGNAWDGSGTQGTHTRDGCSIP